jgi:CHAT domain-containing protein
LVILSACATMRGTASRVEGMPSVSRGFLTAGAPLVLGMLWEIEDEAAARLLLAFHERLRKPATASEALRETQCAFIHSSDAAAGHPASWAAAELLGVD